MRPMEALKNNAAVLFATGVAGMAPGVSAATAEAAPVAPGPVPEATAASFGWANVGGDPLVPGGIETRQDYVNVITSEKGRSAMILMGLNTTERAAWKKAARQGKERACSVNTGEHFDVMSYGAGNVSVDRDVTLTDPDYKDKPLKGLCLDFNVGKKVIETFVADPCANLTVMDERFVTPTSRKPKKALVTATKYAKDAEGKLFKHTPTGEFEFVVKCLQNRKPLVRKVTYNHTPQNLANCDTGSKVTVTESAESKTERAQGKDLWVNETPLSQSQVTKRRNSKSTKGNNFVFVNKQVKAPKPAEVVVPIIDCSGDTVNTANGNTGSNIQQAGNCVTQTIIVKQPPKEEKPVVNLPPNVDLIRPQHLIVNGVAEVCAYESDPEDDIASRNFSEIGGGNFTSFIYPGDEKGEYCIKYTPGTLPEDNVSITYTVYDKAANKASDTESFPIHDDSNPNDPRGQF